MADPDLELRVGGGGRGGRGGGGLDLLATASKGGGGGKGRGGLDLLATATIFPSVISSFFTQNRGGPPLDPPLQNN